MNTKTLAILLAATVLGSLTACRTKAATECDKRVNHCMRRCQVTDSELERDTVEDSAMTGDNEANTQCEQMCHEDCGE